MKERTGIPVSFLNPTARKRPIAHPSSRPGAPAVDDGRANAQAPRAKTEADGSQRVDGAHHLWRSRDNRKGMSSPVHPPFAASPS
ncbi:hypothetical protein V492_06102 [Pseudogymnoascus sp. VKM F-4246]|nr:hypothetical protein V492_06102 [Pseudogymnoascus sp. VKM F-4246]